MAEFCTRCGTAREEDARFCVKCQLDFQAADAAPPVTARPLSEEEQVGSFVGMMDLAVMLQDEQEILRKGDILAPLQRFMDNMELRKDLEQAVNMQKEAILQGYSAYAQAEVQRIVDRVHNRRRQEAAQVDVEILRQIADIQNTLHDAEHRRTRELQSAQHQHEREMLQLAAELNISSKIIEAGNEIQMIQLESDVKGKAKVREMQRYQDVIRENFNALAAIDASNLDYVRQLKSLGFDDLTDSESFHRIEDFVNALMESMSQKVLQFGQELENSQDTP